MKKIIKIITFFMLLTMLFGCSSHGDTSAGWWFLFWVLIVVILIVNLVGCCEIKETLLSMDCKEAEHINWWIFFFPIIGIPYALILSNKARYNNQKRIIELLENKNISNGGIYTGSTISGDSSSLLKRALIFLEAGNWDSAYAYAENALNYDPENALGYLYKLMSILKVKEIDNLKDLSESLDDYDDYKNAIRFAKQELKSKLIKINEDIKTNSEEKKFKDIYVNANELMQKAYTERDYIAASSLFSQITSYSNSDKLAKECLDKAENCRKESIYNSAISKMSSNIIENCEEAITLLETIPNWKDSNEQIKIIKNKINELKVQQETDRKEAERKAEEKRVADEIAKKKRKKAAIVIAIIAAIIVVSIVIVNTIIIPNSKYNSAIKQIEEGNLVEGYKTLASLGNYKDSKEKAAEIYSQYMSEKIKTANVGDTVSFGSYEQDNNTVNGKENIEWIVLAKEDNKALLISKYGLDAKPYNNEHKNVIWEDSSLRKWLNEDFINTAFTTEEQSKILTTNVSADNGIYNSTNLGSNTEDKVFLLSALEATNYFSSDEDRKTIPTEYAISQGAYTSDEYTKDNKLTCFWWLRSAATYQNNASFVRSDGTVNYSGTDVGSTYGCIRPALWLNIE